MPTKGFDGNSVRSQKCDVASSIVEKAVYRGGQQAHRAGFDYVSTIPPVNRAGISAPKPGIIVSGFRNRESQFYSIISDADVSHLLLTPATPCRSRWLPRQEAKMNVSYRTTEADGVKVFYREAGAIDAPTVLLLHGFPASSHMYRNLIPALADRYHVVAPDLPGFGFSGAPDRAQFKYTFDNLAKVVERFTETVGLKRYAIYLFDYGAPVGFRLALAHPERITAHLAKRQRLH
jgi:hypothetical protein